MAEYLVKNSNEVADSNKDADAINFNEDSPSFLNNVGTANARTVSSSSTSTAPKKTTPPSRKTYRPIRSSKSRSKRADKKKQSEILTNPSEDGVPIDLSNYSKPSRLDIVLPEFIVDHVEAHSSLNGNQETNNESDVVSQVIQAEEDRSAQHKEMETDVKKVAEAMKNLEESYKTLYEEIESAKKLFPSSDDPARKTLEEILSTAATPSSILGEGDHRSTILPTTPDNS